jgi:hypothetical protein
MANPKLKERQMTCGEPDCQREWHKKKCEQWNKKNTEYFRSIYLSKKMDTATQSAKTIKTIQVKKASPLLLKSRMNVGLPLEIVQEVIGIQHAVIIDYFGQLLFQRFQEALKRQVIVNTKKVRQLPPLPFSRDDRLSKPL